MHSTNYTEAKAAEEFNQSKGSSSIKKDGIQHKEARLGESL